MSVSSNKRDDLREKIHLTGKRYGYFWTGIEYEPGDDRRNREAFQDQIMSLVDEYSTQAVREKTTTKDALIVQQKKYIRELEAQLNQEDKS